MSKRMWAIIIALVVLLVGTIIFDLVRIQMIKKFTKNFKFPPQTVETVIAKSEVWHPSLPAVGTLKAMDGVDVSPQVAGQITAIYFHTGQEVSKGDPLVQLSDTFDRAQLRHDMAALKLSEVEFRRQKQLYKQHAAATQSLDEAQAKLEQARATVVADKATIDKKRIRAPFSGRVGISNVDVGQYVEAGTALVTLQSMHPLNLEFYLPEQDLKKIKVGQRLVLSVRAYPNQTFEGKILGIDSKVNSSTRNFKVEGEVPNKQEKLYPGIFATLAVILPDQKNVITIPQTAITYTLYGDSVFHIHKKIIEVPSPKNKNKKITKTVYIAKRQAITLGDTRDSVVAITKGLKAGDVIINAGQVKVQDGATVIINNKYALKEGA